MSAPFEWLAAGGARTLVAMITLVGALVLIHEGGHFLVARAFGVTVKVFSIGVGKRLFGVKLGKTDYRISALPIGGYVRWLGSDPFSDSGTEDDEDWIDAKGSFIHKPAWQRLLIVAAGPATNLVLPLLVFTGLYVLGEPQPAAELGAVAPDSPAAKAGLVAGDTLSAVDGVAVLTWGDVYERLDAHEAPTLVLAVSRGGEAKTVELSGLSSVWEAGFTPSYADAVALVDDPTSPAGRAGVLTGDTISEVDGKPVRTWVDIEAALGQKDSATLTILRSADEAAPPPRTLTLQADPAWAPARFAADDPTWARWGLAAGNLGIGRIRALDDDRASAAQCSDLKVGDRLLRVGGREVYSYNDVVRGVAASVDGVPSSESKARPVEFVVRRAGQVITTTVTPDVTRTVGNTGAYELRPIVGLQPVSQWLPPLDVPRPYPLLAAMGRAAEETWGTAGFMVGRIGDMITGGAPVSQNLGGPVAVFSALGAAAEHGLFAAARTFAQLSLSLGVVNLLPIPVLDGGQIVTYLAEWVRGRPLPYVLRERMQQGGLLFLVSLMLLVSVWDIQKHIGSDDEPVHESAPKCT